MLDEMIAAAKKAGKMFAMNTGPHPLDQALTLFGDGMPGVRCWMDRTRTYTRPCDAGPSIFIAFRGY